MALKRSWLRRGVVALVAVSGMLVVLARRKAMDAFVGTRHASSLPETREDNASVGTRTVVSLPPDAPPTPARFAAVGAALMPLAAALGLACWTLAQARLLESRHPVVPMLLYLAGLALVIPALQASVESGRGEHPVHTDDAAGRWLTRDVLAVLVLMLVAAAMQVQAGFGVGSIFAGLLVPAVYILGRALESPLTGVLAAAFTAVSVWPLTLAKPDSAFLALAVMVSVGLALLNSGLQKRAIWYSVGGAAISFLALVAAGGDLSLTSWNQAAADGLSPLLTLLDSLSASLLLFNLAGDPNPLHGLANRPVFAPPLAALFIFGLLAWAVQLRYGRRWLDAFPLIALVVALLPSALAVHYPDSQRAALALPVTVFFAAHGASVLVRLLLSRLGNLGAALALWLVLAALVLTAADAVHYSSTVTFPPIEQTYPD